MGCCMSTNKEDDSDQQRSDHHFHTIKHPLPSMEVESVKEVLSEIPTPKPPEPIKEHLSLTQIDDHSDVVKSDLNKIHYVTDMIPPASTVEISEVSETCSLSESISTTTVRERRDDDGEVCQRINRSPAKFRKNYQSYSGDLGTRKEMKVGLSPNRRSDLSPCGRTGGRPIRPVQSKDPAIAMRGLRSEPPKRESKDAVNRRSMSPATRSNVGRSPGRKSNKSPGSFDGSRSQLDHRTDDVKTQNESMENPLVSLECFIFL